ncbi:MAG TPA: S8 family serine peptidase, partial [Bacteroidales bacterium]|nr:S8 family serine peptidase [Bacteroidales bacterium]
QKLGLTILNKSKWLNSVAVFTTDSELIDTIDRLSFIKSKTKFEKGSSKKRSSNSINENQAEIFTSNEKIDYGDANVQVGIINTHVLHQNNFQGQGIIIAVLDAGFYNVDLLPAFDSLWINQQILGVKDFVDGDTQVFDASDHGMKVLSVMGGNIPGKLVGTAPKAKYWLLRSEQTEWEYSVEEDNWAAAAEFADSVGADIINSSLGYSEFDNAQQNYTYSDMDGNTAFITRAADMASSKGILVVSSAGNLGDDSWNYISAPADGDSVLTVGAVDSYANYVSFSSKGPTYDGRIKPDISAMGYRVTIQGTDGNTTLSNGTSFSSPLIAGAAACLWQALPELTNAQVIQKIRESAHQYSKPDYLSGYGIPDFAKASGLNSTNIITFTSDKEIIKIYPNPFESYIYVEIGKKLTKELKVEIFDITGKKVFTEFFTTSEKEVKIDSLHHLKKGLYLVRVYCDGHFTSTSICK